MFNNYENACTCPIIEPRQDRVLERTFMHNVEHIIPVNTHIVNRHVYTHTYTPRYTCTEENQIINNECGKCNGFR